MSVHYGDVTYKGLQVFEAAARLGTTSDTTAGNIRWNGSNFQGYNGSGWVELDSVGGGGTHAIGGATHTADTLANLNTKINDATLIDTNDARLSDDRTASGIRTATTIVAVSTATAPTTGQVLKATSSTAATWQDEAGGGGTPGGSDDQIQFNNGGAFGGAALYWNDTLLQIGGQTSGSPGLKDSGAELQVRLADDSAAADVRCADVRCTDLVAGGFVRAGGGQVIRWNGRTVMTSPVNGDLRLTNSAQNDFGMIQLGGTTSAYSGVKRSGAAVHIRVADDSAFANLQCQGLGIWGVSPPGSQPTKINDPAGGSTIDAEARTAINAIIDVLEGMGASSST